MSTKLKGKTGKTVLPFIGNTTPVYVGCVMDATNEASRYTAMAQLYDIAQRIEQYPSTDFSSLLTAADCGIVCKLPFNNAEMFADFDFDILFQKNQNTQTHPASTTKVMSLITGLNSVSNLQEIVTVSENDIETGSGSTYYAGDKLSIESVMYAMMMESSNTLTNAFARFCGRRMLHNDQATDAEAMTEFISQMNKKAVEIGMTGSAFDTPHGMTKTNLSTAHDMLLATINACSYPWILRAWHYDISRTIHVFGDNARNIALTKTTPTSMGNYAVLGGKTGTLYYTEFSAQALVMIATAK